MPCFVGIDVAQVQLDIAWRPSGERWAVANDASGVAPRVDRVQTRHPILIVREATGGLERLVPSAFAMAGLPVVVVKPRPARDCALAHCADVIRPTPRPLPNAQPQERRALVGRHQPLIGMRTAEQHRLAGTSARLPKAIVAHMTWLNAAIAPLDHDRETTLRASPLWRDNDELLQRATGIGPVCARTLL